jgi:hypothetical protein
MRPPSYLEKPAQFNAVVDAFIREG